MPPMRECLPTPREIRGRLRAIAKQEKQAAFERRLECRRLLFSVSDGTVKGLTTEERKFCTEVWKESYRIYLETFHGGKPRYACGKSWQSYHDQRKFKNTTPLGPHAHHIQWFRSQKARWVRFDLPMMMKERREAQNGGTPAVPEFHQEKGM